MGIGPVESEADLIAHQSLRRYLLAVVIKQERVGGDDSEGASTFRR